MTHDVNLGAGNATGMFYHAPAGTSLPTYPSEELAEAWVEVGAVSEDGIAMNTNRNFTQLKNWAKQIERILPGEDSGTVAAPIIDTTEESFKTIFGAEHVVVTPATKDHGKLISVDLTEDSTPDAEAFIFLMKDGDDMLMVGTEKGYVTELDEVAFQPNNAITWGATISADKWRILKDDGQKTT